VILKTIPFLPIPRLVFYPHTSIPLIIAEPTYVQLVEDALERGIPIGITLAEPQYMDGRLRYTPRLVGTIGHPQIQERLQDGSLKIILHGLQRVKLTQLIQNIPFLVFDVEPIEDIFERFVISPFLIKRLRTLLDDWLMQNIEDSCEREFFSNSIKDIPTIIDHICLLMIKDTETRQILLENYSLSERLFLLDCLFPNTESSNEDYLAKNALKSFETLEQRIVVNH
jgi:ATP-dependent Lon protease